MVSFSKMDVFPEAKDGWLNSEHTCITIYMYVCIYIGVVEFDLETHFSNEKINKFTLGA